jgi:hypothetical protein
MMTGMKKSTIKLAIRKKIDDWLETIEDRDVRKVAIENTIVSGGCIASMLQGESPKDYDIYFRTLEAAALVAKYYVAEFNKTQGILKHAVAKNYNPEVQFTIIKNCKGVDEKRVTIFMQSSGIASDTTEEYRYFEGEPEIGASRFIDSLVMDEPLEIADAVVENLKDKKLKRYRPVFLTDNAITLTNKMQLVIRFYGTPAEIHDNYDFVHAMCYYDVFTGELNVTKEALESILSKSLIYAGSLYPIASVFRIRKFLDRGWRISAGQILKMLFQISDLDLHDMHVLKEQLLGVDAAYMHELITTLETTKERIDETYLAKLIDKIFEEK